jgi:hypothetical protein
LQRQTPQIVVSGTAQKITKQGNPWVFRSATSGYEDSLGSGEISFTRNIRTLRKVGFIYVNDDFGKGGLDAFTARADNLGHDDRGGGKLHARGSGFRSSAESNSRRRRSDTGGLVAVYRGRADCQAAAEHGSEFTSLRLGRKLASEIPGVGRANAANGWYYRDGVQRMLTTEGVPAAKPFVRGDQAKPTTGIPSFVHAQAWDAAHASSAGDKRCGIHQA